MHDVNKGVIIFHMCISYIGMYIVHDVMKNSYDALKDTCHFNVKVLKYYMNILELSWEELRKAYTEGSLKPSQVIDAYIEQMQQTSYLNAYITMCVDLARKAAKESDQRYAHGTARALEGMPLALKDVFCTKGIKTTASSKMLENFIPDYESFVSQCLADDGAIMLGKTNMDEFAMGSSTMYGYFGTAFNPWIGKRENPCCVGGSSGGSAAVVASYQALCAIGTDTGGSVRQPAAFAGIVGIRPTYGTCSRRGMIAFSSLLDQAGVFARDVYTAASCLDSIMRTDVMDATHERKGVMNLAQIALNTDKITHLKIGVLANVECIKNDQILESIKQVSQILVNDGVKCEKVTLHCLDHAIAVYYVLTPPQSSSNLAMYDGTRYGAVGEGKNYAEQSMNARNNFQEEVKRRILLGNFLLSHEAYDKYYNKALQVQQLMKDEFAHLFEKVDVIITPTTPHTAFDLTQTRQPHEMYYEDYYTVVVNIAGLCAISIPVGLDEDGMPIGLQLIAPAFREDLLIQVAKYLEHKYQFQSLQRIDIVSQAHVDQYNKS